MKCVFPPVKRDINVLDSVVIESKTLPFFGKVDILLTSSESNVLIMRKRRSMKSLFKEKIPKNLIELNHPNLLSIEAIKEHENQECEIYFENVLYTLEEEIQRRRDKAHRFTNQELFEIIDQISSALAYLHEKNIVHGGINTQSILRISSSQYKIVHPVFIEESQTNREKVGERGSILSFSRFIPPEIRFYPKTEISSTETNRFKEDIYALGVAIIDASLLDLTDSLLSSRMERVNKEYSPIIYRLLEKLTHPKQTERIDIWTLRYIMKDSEVESQLDHSKSWNETRNVHKPFTPELSNISIRETQPFVYHFQDPLPNEKEQIFSNEKRNGNNQKALRSQFIYTAIYGSPDDKHDPVAMKSESYFESSPKVILRPYSRPENKIKTIQLYHQPVPMGSYSRATQFTKSVHNNPFKLEQDALVKPKSDMQFNHSGYSFLADLNTNQTSKVSIPITSHVPSEPQARLDNPNFERFSLNSPPHHQNIPGDEMVPFVQSIRQTAKRFESDVDPSQRAFSRPQDPYFPQPPPHDKIDTELFLHMEINTPMNSDHYKTPSPTNFKTQSDFSETPKSIPSKNDVQKTTRPIYVSLQDADIRAETEKDSVSQNFAMRDSGEYNDLRSEYLKSEESEQGTMKNQSKISASQREIPMVKIQNQEAPIFEGEVTFSVKSHFQSMEPLSNLPRQEDNDLLDFKSDEIFPQPGFNDNLDSKDLLPQKEVHPKDSKIKVWESSLNQQAPHHQHARREHEKKAGLRITESPEILHRSSREPDHVNEIDVQSHRNNDQFPLKIETEEKLSYPHQKLMEKINSPKEKEENADSLSFSFDRGPNLNQTTQSRPAEENLTTITILGDPLEPVGLSKLSKGLQNDTVFLLSSNDFVTNSYKIKRECSPFIRIVHEDLKKNTLSNVLRRSIGSVSARQSPAKRFSVKLAESPNQASTIIQDDMKELFEDFYQHKEPKDSKKITSLNYVTIEEKESLYQGEIYKGKRHGRGNFYLKNGERYEGEWKDGKMEGYGVFWGKDGKKLHEGHYSQGLRDGFGREYNGNPVKSIGENSELGFNNFEKLNDSWIKFEGTFKHNDWEGIGKLFFVNEDMYFGEFKKNLISGKGCLYSHKGETYPGTWEGGNLLK